MFGSSKTITFAGLSVLVCGDLHQLRQVNPPELYSPINNLNSAAINDLNFSLASFLMVELTEIMRQSGDTTLIQLLIKIRIGGIDDFVK